MIMIDKKKIEEAANLHLEEVRDIYRDEVFGVSYPTESKDIEGQIMDDFTDGANWAIGEFKKSLWHDAREEPIPHGDEAESVYPHVVCLIEDAWGFGVRYWNTAEKYWDDEDADDYYCDKEKVERWCYIDDLLPKKGEKK